MEKRDELGKQRPETSAFKGPEKDSDEVMDGEDEDMDDGSAPAGETSGIDAADSTASGTGSQVAVEDTNMEACAATSHDGEDDENDKDDDTDSVSSNLSISSRYKMHHGTDPTDDMYRYYEETSYDPRLLALKDIKWLDRCRTLGYNAQAPDVTKAFISGLGRYVDYGSFEIVKAGNDPNDIGADEYDCYTAGGGDVDDPTFPFHEACYRVLAKYLECSDSKEIDKDVLYGVVRQCGEDWGGNLNLDYGGVQAEQFWDCQPGEEYLVCSPDQDSELQRILPSLLPDELLSTSASPDLSHKVQHDPLGVLHFDILCGICQCLPIEDTLKLMQASYHVSSLTRNRTFWRQMTRLHLAPWLWETKNIACNRDPYPDFDHKGLFLWLDKVTRPTFGMEGPFMGIANRRRIWNVCEQLAPVYNLRVNRARREEPDDEDAQVVLDTAVSLHMPMTMYPQPADAQTISAQFVRSWDEIENQPSDET
ncbi:hypothetical protein BU25DRAFT_462263 [Macroventuria anomochaeta]|uniref:Uncharacterized protein n=1 Tax=Macroventuria anomochaeta TaxID=301207 RepID=A0ACB6RPM9_9PLEO|nr:uncharacterized protein BU25DRAFT_462263 [Macroventuria anomochaeta]KAF2623114.1 hypothetical protein BU25DRAFT_462263 [Macroventuria anomochaeta]